MTSPTPPAVLDEAPSAVEGLDTAQLAAVITGDPLLRLYCSVPRAGAPVSPWPPHPAFPGGTQAISVRDLTASANAGVLVRVADGSRRPDPPAWLAEYLFRPIAAAFRVALDRYGIVIDTDPARLLVELSPEHRPTGRVVVTAIIGPASRDDDTPPTRAAAQHAAMGMARCLVDLAVALTRTMRPAGDQVHGVVHRIMTEELRFLSPSTVALLTGDLAPGRYPHGIAPEQDRILRKVLTMVEERARARRTDPALRRPAVMLDLDLTALDGRRRLRHAMREVSGPRPGAPDGIAELATPGTSRVLPSYPAPSWNRFVAITGLRERYPEVDFEKLHDDFVWAYYRPWSNLTWDTPVAGMAKFARDVQHRGGEVVFNSGRRERVRAQTEEVLARAGLRGSHLMLMSDDRTRPIAELKAERLHDIAGLEVVAVFDDLADNLRALSTALPEACPVAVALPGLAAPPDQWPGDTIASFERTPRQVGPAYGCALSHAHSIAELDLHELKVRPVTADHAVWLSMEESAAVVERLVTRADRAAEYTAGQARARLGELMAATGGTENRSVLLIHHLLGRKQFHRGSRATYPLATAVADMLPWIERGEPVQVVLPSFPVKLAESRLKSFGPLPDLAELALLVRLRELQTAVRHVYEPGLRITLLADGRHYRPRPPALTNAYLRRIEQYVRHIGGEEFLEIEELGTAATRWLGASVTDRRPALVAANEEAIWQAYAEIDVTEDPVRALEHARTLDPAARPELGPGVADLFPSMVHSVKVPVPHGVDRRDWSRRIYADLYNLADPTVPEQLITDRKTVLMRAWADTIHYVAGIRADHTLGYDEILAPRVRLSNSIPRPGRSGFAGLGGSVLLPWHGTATVDPRGNVSTDFAISLLDQGFVPVYSPLSGPGQPWLMAPITATRGPGRGRPAEIAPEFLASLRLRRR